LVGAQLAALALPTTSTSTSPNDASELQSICDLLLREVQNNHVEL
jgi:hypothetical protein